MTTKNNLIDKSFYNRKHGTFGKRFSKLLME